MTASNVAAQKTADDVAAPSPAKDVPVKQWFRGEIEASYYGVPSRVPAASSDSVGKRYRLHIYRAAVLRAEPFDNPDTMQPQEGAATEVLQIQEPFFQASIEIAQLWGVRGNGTRYEGPIHDVSIAEPQTRFHVVKDNKSYGTMRGYAQGWMYLPAREAIPERPIEVDQAHRELPKGVLIHEPQENSVKESVQDKRTPVDRKREPETVDDVSIDDVDSVRSKRTTSQKTEPPYFSFCAAIGLLLWFTCGAEQTVIWCLFMLPTLGMRRLVLDILPDERGVQAFAAVMVFGAILSSGTIFANFSTQNCWTLETVPLVILVGSVFLSGIVPYRLPLAITALAFAGVLYMWGHAPERHCPAEVSGESLPTIKDPGVPRTNDDGTWPRRVPAAESETEGK